MTTAQDTSHDLSSGLTIHALRLRNVAGVEQLDLQLDPSGVTVVHGRNEAGKSTVLQAFQLLLSDVKTSSRRQSVQDLYPVGKQGRPVIEAEMTVGDYELTIAKKFTGGKSTAVLNVTEPRVENLTNRQAEERFLEIIDEGVDTTLLEALTVEQGASLEPFVASEVQALSAALDQHAADSDDDDGSSAIAIDGDDDATAAELMQRVEQEYQRFYTRKGSRRSAGYQAVWDEVAELEAEVDEAQAIYADAQQLIEAIAQNRDEMKRIEQKIPEAEAEVTTLAEALETAKKAQVELDKRKAAVTQAQQAVDLAAHRSQERTKMAERVAAVEAELATLSAQQEELADKATAERKEADQVKESLRVIKARRVIVRSYAQLADALDRQAAATVDVQKLEKQKKDTAEAASTIATLEKQVADNPMTADVVATLQKADQDLSYAARERELISTEVTITGPEGTITDDDQDVELPEAGYSAQVTSSRTFGLGEYEVAVVPSQSSEVAGQKYADVAARVEEVFAGYDLEPGDMATAREREHARRKLEAQLNEARLTFSSASAGMSSDQIASELDAATRRQETAQQDVDHYRKQTVRMWDGAEVAEERLAEEQPEDFDLAADIEAIRNDVPADFSVDTVAVKQWLEAIDDRAEQLQSRRETMADSALLRKHAAIVDRVAAAQQRGEQERAALEEAQEEQADEALESALTAAKAQLGTAQEAFAAEKQSQQGQLPAETVADQVAAEETRLKSLRDRSRGLEVDLKGKTTELGSRDGAAEDLAEAEARLERAQRKKKSMDRQAAAVSLLKQTMDNAQAELRQRYAEPLSEAFHMLARGVYGPDVRFELDDDLQVARRIDHGVAIEVEQLSGGAREQINLLSRLAVATLAARGRGVPIFLDDSLGFSDEYRSRSMNQVLSKLGQQHQVVVLTCEMSRFDRIAGAEMLDVDSLKRGADDSALLLDDD